MPFIADFHIHSKYSRATSRDMDIENISKWAKIKGIDLIGTGDFTHPVWLEELKAKLDENGKGILSPKIGGTPQFILTAEICTIFTQDGKVRKVHSLVLAPSFEVVDKINAELSKVGNLAADGRPILGLSVKHLFEIVMSASPDCLLIPCHAWTPHFAVFGSNSGFDSLEEAFGEYADQIYAIETGMSSDPAMNWRLSALDRVTLISCSDAHSPRKLGREAVVFDCDLDYAVITGAIKTKDRGKILYTIEFFPQEGKYHLDGHRKCGVCWTPEETKKRGGVCPVCLKPVTVGVMHRVDALADREVGFVPKGAIPFKSIVPLVEIISEVMGKGPASKAVEEEYLKMIGEHGNEFKILLELPLAEISNEKIREGLAKMREGEISISPGHDGEYGKVSIWGKAQEQEQAQGREQLGMF